MGGGEAGGWESSLKVSPQRRQSRLAGNGLTLVCHTTYKSLAKLRKLLDQSVNNGIPHTTLGITLPLSLCCRHSSQAENRPLQVWPQQSSKSSIKPSSCPGSHRPHGLVMWTRLEFPRYRAGDESGSLLPKMHTVSFSMPSLTLTFYF